ncbi:hypothetical protein [Snodgrassella alvi]|uniref:hypothetical protein n=1 Tax=Snodgrassella alvi TaxID=1196083 RepID=UPI000C1F6752|nr:hypothetical protein [Snodgrassella alvi]PIT17844.1 hypothetical protein BGI33_02245 [Snodgrassella alvi]
MTTKTAQASQILNNQNTEAAEVVINLAAIRYQAKRLQAHFLNAGFQFSDSEFFNLAFDFIEIVSSKDVPAFIARQAYEPGKVVFSPFLRLKPFFAALRARQWY